MGFEVLKKRKKEKTQTSFALLLSHLFIVDAPLPFLSLLFDWAKTLKAPW